MILLQRDRGAHRTREYLRELNIFGRVSDLCTHKHLHSPHADILLNRRQKMENESDYDLCYEQGGK
jgi:hypothetical protein